MNESVNRMDYEKIICEKAEQEGFAAAFMDVKDLVSVPEYRKYCEMNLCGQYDLNPSCPPGCGSVEALLEKAGAYSRALILQTIHDCDFTDDPQGGKQAKADHNRMADQLLEYITGELKLEVLRISAGPWKKDSCMSAYCLDAQAMADSVDMVCWADDGKTRFFSLILFE